MRTLIALLLITFTLSACGQCYVKEGNYSSSGGTEEETTLSLAADKTFIAKFKRWQAGHYESHKTTKIKGTWLCKNRLVEFKTDNHIYPAEIITIGENPLGLSPDTKALLFKENNNHFLNNALLYPDI